MKKTKVVWLCHFSNNLIREKLPLSKMRLRSFTDHVFGLQKHHGFSDFTPWITSLINEFKNFTDIELHIISPHSGMRNFITEFNVNNVYYHFFKPDLPFIHKKIPQKYFLGKNPKYLFNRFLIARLISKIKPDLINIFGTENPYYSIAAIDLKNIPIYLSVQTVYTNPDRYRLSGDINENKWNVELKIHSKIKYFGCTGRMYKDLIINNNPDAIIFKMFFPVSKPKNIPEQRKKFDFVFFAAVITAKKGIEDTIDALAIVKTFHENVSLNIIGKCNKEYFDYLNSKIGKLNLEENIIFNSYFPMHTDMFNQVKKSRFALLPVKLDVIPGTVLEAIYLNLPVITYKTSGTPYLNKDGEAVLIAEIGDIDALAKHMLSLLSKPEIGDKLLWNAKNILNKEFDNTVNAQRLRDNYYAVLNHYHHNIPIPEEQLMNTAEFPIY